MANSPRGRSRATGWTLPGADFTPSLSRIQGTRSGRRQAILEPQLRELLPSARGHGEGPAVLDACHPAPLQEDLRQRGADGAGEVMPSLGPVDTGAAVSPLRAPHLPEVDAEAGEEPLAGAGQLAATVGEHDVVAAQHQVAQGDAEAAGQVVVAQARLP